MQEQYRIVNGTVAHPLEIQAFGNAIFQNITPHSVPDVTTFLPSGLGLYGSIAHFMTHQNQRLAAAYPPWARRRVHSKTVHVSDRMGQTGLLHYQQSVYH